MADIVRKFGELVNHETVKNPAAARKLLMTGFRAFGLKLDHKPDKRLPGSRQYIASLLNHQVVDMLAHPQEAALTNIFMPSELLHAAGIRPLCAELYSTFVNGAYAERVFADAAEEEGIAETFCSYHKILMGSAYTGVLPKPAVIVNTSLICDANNLTFRALAEHYGIGHYYIDVPSMRGEDSIQYVADQFREMKKFLEDELHRKISEEKLKEVMVRSDRTIKNLRAAAVLKGEHTLPGDIASEMYEVYVSHIGLGLQESLDYSRMLCQDLRNAPDRLSNEKDIRLLWIHTIPNWPMPLRNTFNFAENAHILSCDINYDSLIRMDPEKPYESMARRLVESTFNGDGSRRIEAARKMAQVQHADGAVIFCHWGCKETAGLAVQMKEELERSGCPSLILNGDGCDTRNASDGQTATRITAFMEMLGKKNEE